MPFCHQEKVYMHKMYIKQYFNPVICARTVRSAKLLLIIAVKISFHLRPLILYIIFYKVCSGIFEAKRIRTLFNLCLDILISRQKLWMK